MKKMLIAGILLLPGALVLAQSNTESAKTEVTVKTGTSLDYDVNSNGQLTPLTMKIFIPDEGGIGFEFSVGDMTGKFINSREGLEKGSNTNWDEPYQGEERKLGPDQTLAIFSKAFLKDLKQNKKAKYDGSLWQLKDLPKGSELILDNKATPDAIYMESENGSTKYWILNNEDYPLMLKVEGNQKGPDLILKAVH